MADGISLRVITSDVQKDFARISKDSSRATMWTARAGGRVAKQVAKRVAPRYAGPKRNTYDFGDVAPLVPGELRKSIHSSKRLTRYGRDGYRVTVAPRGRRTWLYAGKQEQAHGYLEAGRAAAAERLPALAEQAYDRVTRRR